MLDTPVKTKDKDSATFVDEGLQVLPPGATSTAAEPLPPTLKVIVAVHGVGEQLRCEAEQAVAARFALDMNPALPLMPLGHFHVGRAGDVGVSALIGPPRDWDSDDRRNIHFAEVYWANVPRDIVKQADTLEEAKAWGRTVVSRARALHDTYVRGDLDPGDFELAAGAVDEIVETVGVLENLLAVLAKAGIFKFDLAPLLRNYVGDVQVVADFALYRDAIVSSFQQVLDKVDEAMTVMAHELAARHAAVHRWDADRTRQWEAQVGLEIHVVAHSEGTVVSFLGLLKALSGVAVADPTIANATAPGLGWVRHVRGFMTFGSPIDKHLVLWPEIWKDLRHIRAPGGIAIEWRNYYDHGDPIGFELDTARQWMQDNDIDAFRFGPGDDVGFARYLLPGKAHIDYWKDKDVFRHFIDDVVIRRSKSPPPSSKWLPTLLGAPLAYTLTITFHAAAVYLLYKAVASWQVKDHATTLATVVNVLVLTCLLGGVTFAARLPRLVNRRRWIWLPTAVVGFLVGAAPLWMAVQGVRPPPIVALDELMGSFGLARRGDLAMLLVALITASSGWWAARTPRHGRRWLVSLGSTAVASLVLLVMTQSWSAGGANLQPVWPVMLGGLAFVYSWWVGILTFDLAFLWHRYVRNNVAARTLHAWHRARCASGST
jgi:hypothetical protein